MSLFYQRIHLFALFPRLINKNKKIASIFPRQTSFFPNIGDSIRFLSYNDGVVPTSDNNTIYSSTVSPKQMLRDYQLNPKELSNPQELEALLNQLLKMEYDLETIYTIVEAFTLPKLLTKQSMVMALYLLRNNGELLVKFYQKCLKYKDKSTFISTEAVTITITSLSSMNRLSDALAIYKTTFDYIIENPILQFDIYLINNLLKLFVTAQSNEKLLKYSKIDIIKETNRITDYLFKLSILYNQSTCSSLYQIYNFHKLYPDIQQLISQMKKHGIFFDDNTKLLQIKEYLHANNIQSAIEFFNEMIIVEKKSPSSLITAKIIDVLIDINEKDLALQLAIDWLCYPGNIIDWNIALPLSKLLLLFKPNSLHYNNAINLNQELEVSRSTLQIEFKNLSTKLSITKSSEWNTKCSFICNLIKDLIINRLDYTTSVVSNSKIDLDRRVKNGKFTSYQQVSTIINKELLENMAYHFVKSDKLDLIISQLKSEYAFNSNDFYNKIVVTAYYSNDYKILLSLWERIQYEDHLTSKQKTDILCYVIASLIKNFNASIVSNILSHHGNSHSSTIILFQEQKHKQYFITKIKELFDRDDYKYSQTLRWLKQLLLMDKQLVRDA